MKKIIFNNIAAIGVHAFMSVIYCDLFFRLNSNVPEWINPTTIIISMIIIIALVYLLLGFFVLRYTKYAFLSGLSVFIIVLSILVFCLMKYDSNAEFLIFYIFSNPIAILFGFMRSGWLLISCLFVSTTVPSLLMWIGLILKNKIFIVNRSK